jgi:1-acyl-sn-glycerol-3-phosphate acyltransferase
MSWFDRITYPGMRLFAQVIAANRLEMKVTGLAHVPEYGPAVLVARHYHHLFDGVALFLSIPRPIHILVTLDWTKSTHVRRLMKRATTLARWPVVLRNENLRPS